MSTTFGSYRDAFPNIRFTCDDAGVLVIASHTDGEKPILATLTGNSSIYSCRSSMRTATTGSSFWPDLVTHSSRQDQAPGKERSDGHSRHRGAHGRRA